MVVGQGVKKKVGGCLGPHSPKGPKFSFWGFATKILGNFDIILSKKCQKKALKRIFFSARHFTPGPKIALTSENVSSDWGVIVGHMGVVGHWRAGNTSGGWLPHSELLPNDASWAQARVGGGNSSQNFRNFSKSDRIQNCTQNPPLGSFVEVSHEIHHFFFPQPQGKAQVVGPKIRGGINTVSEVRPRGGVFGGGG